MPHSVWCRTTRFHPGPRSPPLFHRDVRDFPAENLRHEIGNFGLAEFFRAIERVNLASVLGWMIENCRNHAALIRRRDGSIARVANGKRENVFLSDGLR